MIKNKKLIKKFLQESFNSTLSTRVDRYLKINVHDIIPYHFFSNASSECKQMYVDGHYYGCISLSQAVAEGLSKFIIEIKKIRASKDFKTRIDRLTKANMISNDSANAFIKIIGDDRNNYHHLNKEIKTDYTELQKRAEECLEGLYVIESEIFAYKMINGKLQPNNLIYWPNIDSGLADVFLRFM